MTVKALSRDGRTVETGRVSKVLAFRGLERPADRGGVAGDIVAISGLATATVADTLCDPAVTEAIPAHPIDPPTLADDLSRVNDSPLAGTEGDKVTSRQIRDRLWREAEGNVALQVREGQTKDSFEVAGRGELQLSILIETMRREGFELAISRPRVVFKSDETTGQRLEPVEEVVVDVDEGYAGTVIDKLTQRRGELVEMRPSGGAKQRLVLYVPTRGLIGYFLRVHDRHPRNRRDVPPVPRLGALQGRGAGPAHRRADRQLAGRGGGLCPVEPGGPRPDDDRAWGQGLPGHDRRRAHPRHRPGGQRPQRRRSFRTCAPPERTTTSS